MEKFVVEKFIENHQSLVILVVAACAIILSLHPLLKEWKMKKNLQKASKFAEERLEILRQEKTKPD